MALPVLQLGHERCGYVAREIRLRASDDYGYYEVRPLAHDMTYPDDRPPRPPRLRPRWLYRAAYVWTAVGVAWLLASGRLVTYFGAFRSPLRQPPPNPGPLVATGLLWVVFLAPLLLPAYDLGVQHTEARRFNTSIWRGLRETWRVAWQRPRLDEMAEDFAQRPEDDVSMAVLYGFTAATLPFALFLGAMPMLRTARGVIWVGGAGVLLGVIAYCHRRAAPYLRHDPGAWSLFRQWSLLNAGRYEPAGRRLVHVQLVCSLLLVIWWLGGGILLIA
jgi:hypothetical protein